MIQPAQRSYLLDTSILVHLVRGQALGTWIETTFTLDQLLSPALVCGVSLGEIQVLADLWNWSATRKARLVARLQNFSIHRYS